MMDSLKDDTSQDVTPVFQLVRSQLTSSNASTHSGCRSVSSLGQCPTYISLSDLPSNDLTLNLQLNKNDEIKEFVQSNWEYFYKYKVKKWQLDCYRQRHLQKSPSSSIHNISQSDDDSQSGISRFSSGRNIEEAGGTYLSTAVISDQQDDGFKRPHSVLSKSAIKSYKALETYKQTTLIFKSWTLKLTPQLKLCLRGLMEGINHPVQSDPVVCRLSCWTVASKDSVYVLNTRPETSEMADYFEEMGWQPLGPGETPNHHLHLIRLFRDVGAWELLSLDQKLPPPASKDVVNNLDEQTITILGRQCPVCLKEHEIGEIVKVLPCKHSFHSSCILPWLEKTNTCPLCRHELRTDDEDYELYKKEKLRAKEREEELESLHNSMFS